MSIFAVDSYIQLNRKLRSVVLLNVLPGISLLVVMYGVSSRTPLLKQTEMMYMLRNCYSL